MDVNYRISAHESLDSSIRVANVRGSPAPLPRLDAQNFFWVLWKFLEVSSFSQRRSGLAAHERTGKLGGTDTFRLDLARNEASALTLVADGAMFGFVILHGDFEHVVAAYTDAMNLKRFTSGLGLVRGARMLS